MLDIEYININFPLNIQKNINKIEIRRNIPKTKSALFIYFSKSWFCNIFVIVLRKSSVICNKLSKEKSQQIKLQLLTEK